MTNDSGLEFTDISSEEFRTYQFPGGEFICVNGPTHLHVSENGHRLLDKDGFSYYIPKGWISLKWKAKEGQPNFVR